MRDGRKKEKTNRPVGKRKKDMSTAEITARRIYDSYRFQNLSDEVRRHVAILCLSATADGDGMEDITDALTLSLQEKEVRARKALEDAKAGSWCSTEELCEQLDNKYPWLCK